jgi:hypothetical protein
VLVRIVKLTFDPLKTDEFLTTFESYKNDIRSFPGCQRLELYRDLSKSNVFFTYSYWNCSEDLNNYRSSALFETVWSQTKLLFADQPMAWSVEKLVILE